MTEVAANKTKTPEINPEMIALEVTGLAAFTTLAGEPKRFRKEVLRVGKWIHPVTNEVLDFTREFLARLVLATKRWLALGNKVWFPAGHSSDPRDNLGFWSSFELEGDRVLGLLEVQDEDAASKVGRTIQDVSAAIWRNAKASSGETFEAVLEHVCGTPCPVIPGQANFVRLAREVSSTRDTKAATKLAGSGSGNGSGNAPGETALDLGAAIKVLLGLPQESDDAAVIEAVRALCFDESSEEAEAAENADALGAPVNVAGLATLANLEHKVEELTKENKRIRARAALERVDAAKRRSVELGLPIEDDVRKEALVLFERGDEGSERLGARLLELALRPAELNRAPPNGGGAPSFAGSGSLPSPGAREDEKAELERSAALERAYLSQGLAVEKDPKGRIVRVFRPAANRK